MAVPTREVALTDQPAGEQAPAAEQPQTSLEPTTAAPLEPAAKKKDLAFGIAPASFEDAWRMASIMSRSAFVPKGFQNQPSNILVAMQMGAEIGLSPMQALQSIAVINGRPSLWGDAMLALVMVSPHYVNHDETLDEGTMTAVAAFVRKGKATPIVRQFSKDDAIKANLWTKAGPWVNYPKRMLQMRARALAIRDGFPDVIKGLSIAEEAVDIPAPVIQTVSQPAIPEPHGYSEWLDDLKACAEEGLPQLTSAWSSSRQEYCDYLARTDATAWERLKTIAAERTKQQEQAS